MAMKTNRFDPQSALSAHGAEMLCAPLMPEGVKTPFGHSYGLLEKTGQVMETHSHHTDEMYLFLSGEGEMTVGEETQTLRAGDVLLIPPDVPHSLTCTVAPCLIAALWWDPMND